MNTSKNDLDQNNPYLRTMQKDLESSGNISFSARPEPAAAASSEQKTDPENSPSQIAAPNPPAAVASSSPFAKTYFNESAPGPRPEATTPKMPPAGGYSVASQPPTSQPALVAREDYPAKPARAWGKLVALGALILVLLGLLTGGYFYWKRSPATTPLPTVEEPATIVETPQSPVKVNPLAEKYSLAKPNYLSLDANTATPEDIRKIITTAADEIRQAGVSSPIEFILTDSNNNPIAFHIFCALAKINFPPALLSVLGDNFSLYIYPDESNMRLGLSVDSKNKSATWLQMKTAENKLPATLEIFFPENTPLAAATFKDGSYNGNATRYANLDQVASLSIDYSVNEKTLSLGTSKNTLRAILDKLAQTAISTSVPEGATPAEPAGN